MVELGAPVEIVYVPRLQSIQAERPGLFPCLLAGQLYQTEEPVFGALYVPIAHDKQVVELDKPVLGLYAPPGHKD
jgi:hypothetical protein